MGFTVRARSTSAVATLTRVVELDFATRGADPLRELFGRSFRPGPRPATGLAITSKRRKGSGEPMARRLIERFGSRQWKPDAAFAGGCATYNSTAMVDPGRMRSSWRSISRPSRYSTSQRASSVVR